MQSPKKQNAMIFTGEVGSIIKTDENNIPTHEELDEFEDW